MSIGKSDFTTCSQAYSCKHFSKPFADALFFVYCPTNFEVAPLCFWVREGGLLAVINVEFLLSYGCHYHYSPLSLLLSKTAPRTIKRWFRIRRSSWDSFCRNTFSRFSSCRIFFFPSSISVNVKSSAPHKSCAAVHWRRLL